ncbi:MAG TPA: T9SS type A sorting domain-containing protein [Bacteroidia bacterium]|nr:T9SS type A sorting domain-containing protein [Bacteroidia bacterium]
MKKIITLHFIFFFFSLIASSQESGTANENTSEFLKMQYNFDAWAKDKDLSKEKGWKWYKRWEEQAKKYTNANGSLIGELEYFKEATQVATTKELQIRQGSAATSWIPAGPFVTPGSVGRINTITFHPTNPNIFWVGVAQGGVWKTTNGGSSYIPLTDNLPITRISDIAIDELHPDTMYVSLCDYEYIGVALHLDGRKRNTHYGMGIYKTTDGGNSWSPTGLSFNQTDFDGSLIRRSFVSTTNSNNLVAAGTSGIWKSANGGTNWTKVLDTLIWDIERDPVNKNTLYASGGYVGTLKEGYACVMKSTDFGNTWTMLNTGIPPKGTVQRIELAISKTDPNYVYALCCDMNSGFHGVYRSIDGGTNWTKRATTPNILDWGSGTSSGGQGSYDLTIIVDPVDKNKIYTGGVYIWGSSDGGSTFKQVTTNIHADQHMLAYNPLNQKTYMCNDGGLYATGQMQISSLNATSWTRMNNSLQIPSYYKVATCKTKPGYLLAGAQDNGTIYYNGTTWSNAGGGDGMDCTIDDSNPQSIIVSSQFGSFEKSTNGGQSSNAMNVTSESGEWTTPILRDPTTNATLYAGYENLHKSTNGGTSWSPISTMGGTAITAIAVSPQNSKYIYITKRVDGSTMKNAKVFITSNGGTSWTNITAGLPDSLYFTSVTVADNDVNTAWVTCSGFWSGIKVFKTTNAGISWTNVSGNLPNIPVNCIIHQNGSTNNTLFIGTDIGVYTIDDNLSSWQLFSTGLPNVIVCDLEIHYASKTMYAATFGRGIWSYDLSSTVAVKEDLMKDAAIKINPSVNNGEFQLAISGINADQGIIDILDITGKKVFSESIHFSNGSYAKHFNIDLNYGLYFVKVSADKGGSIVQRFILNK